jgi:hypothetical protein
MVLKEESLLERFCGESLDRKSRNIFLSNLDYDYSSLDDENLEITSTGKKFIPIEDIADEDEDWDKYWDQDKSDNENEGEDEEYKEGNFFPQFMLIGQMMPSLAIPVQKNCFIGALSVTENDIFSSEKIWKDIVMETPISHKDSVFISKEKRGMKKSSRRPLFYRVCRQCDENLKTLPIEKLKRQRRIELRALRGKI